MILAFTVTAAITAALHGIAIQMMTFTTATVALKVSTTIALQALVFALALGLVGGFLPARRAALLSPVEALRRR